jgi:hypothetical protein
VDWKDRQWWPLVTPLMMITFPAAVQAVLWSNFGFLKKSLRNRLMRLRSQPVAASVCQLGNFGTARKELRTLVLKPLRRLSRTRSNHGGAASV